LVQLTRLERVTLWVRVPPGAPNKSDMKNITDEMLTEAVAASTTFREVLRKLGIKEAGGSHGHYTRRAKNLGLDMSHMLGKSSSSGKISHKRKYAADILVKRESGGRAKAEQLVRSLLEIGRKHECEKCGQLPEWHGHPLTLDVDHINEDWLDDRAENLRFLCPNCHSQLSRRLIQK